MRLVGALIYAIGTLYSGRPLPVSRLTPAGAEECSLRTCPRQTEDLRPRALPPVSDMTASALSQRTPGRSSSRTFSQVSLFATPNWACRPSAKRWQVATGSAWIVLASRAELGSRRGSISCWQG